MNKIRVFIAVAAGAIAAVLSFIPVITGERDIDIRAHHLAHAVLIFFGVVSGLALARARDPRGESPRWIWPAILAPLVTMFLMAPSFYAVVDKAPVTHSFNHLLFVLLGAVTAYSGQRYVRGIGWTAAIMLELMALAAAFGYGIAPLVALPPANAPAATAAATTGTDVGRGKTLFSQSCSACHGATGQGGVGPSLRNESSRKTVAQTAAWIKNPAPPMPKLFPSTLNGKDVDDVSAFVQTLK